MSDELQLTYSKDSLTLIAGLYWFSEKLSGTTYVGEAPGLNVYFWRAGYSDGDSYAATPLPPFMLELLRSGGLVPWIGERQSGSPSATAP